MHVESSYSQMVSIKYNPLHVYVKIKMHAKYVMNLDVFMNFSANFFG